jgi:7-carboxy-7-deazaguanine synthase
MAVVEDLMEQERILPEPKRIPVVEIFGPTIEGEGSICGMQTFFIRFGLCDYKCKRCDSMHAVDPRLVKAGAVWMTPAEIVTAVYTLAASKGASHIRNITFSGGNPCVHNLMELVRLLKEHPGKEASGHWKIFVETQGTKHPNWLDLVDHVVVSPKSPGMGEVFEPEVFKAFMQYVWGTFQGVNGPRVTIKIVIFSNQDIEFAAGVAGFIKAHFPTFPLDTDFYLSLGNDAPPVFAIEHAMFNPDTGEEAVPVVVQLDPPSPEKGDKFDQGILLEEDKKSLVGNLLNRYNILSEEIMKDHRLSFARFLPQLHVLIWGNETGR